MLFGFVEGDWIKKKGDVEVESKWRGGLKRNTVAEKFLIRKRFN
jgi:hypothetical protein